MSGVADGSVVRSIAKFCRMGERRAGFVSLTPCSPNDILPARLTQIPSRPQLCQLVACPHRS